MANNFERQAGAADHGAIPKQTNMTGLTRTYTTRQSPSFEPRMDGMKMDSNASDSSRRPKEVKFIYSHARLPLRVQIHSHDTTHSVIASVKTFFGIHEGLGVSFEDEQGYNIIPQYENVKADTDIRVRLTQDMQPLAHSSVLYNNEAVAVPSPAIASPAVGSPAKSGLAGSWMNMNQPYYHPRPASRHNRSGDVSPDPSRKYRFAGKPAKNTKSYDGDGLSDSDAGSVSVTSSRRDVLASADISVENIVEGNRRNGVKFESSELPLFKPPQIPFTASLSSASPQKRFYPNVASPLPVPNYRNVSYGQQAFPSPISHAYSDKTSIVSNNGYSYSRDPYMRSSGGRQTSRLSGGSNNGILPTPAPTIGSALSDEDVALQLMRLGDPNNAPSIRPSASTADDAFSGKAELASSADYSDDASDEAHGGSHRHVQSGPARKKLKALNTAVPSGDLYSSGEDYEDHKDASFQGNSDEIMPPFTTKKSKSKISKNNKSRSVSGSARPTPKAHSSKNKSSAAPGATIPPSPYSASGAQSKGSVSQFASDEEDLSAKPRCQRCRKSKKGCDRQRPCARCKDAGIGIEGCVSEDEGNGRKGRFGRHMGVAVKKDSLESIDTVASAYSGPAAHTESAMPVDVGKKRKR